MKTKVLYLKLCVLFIAVIVLCLTIVFTAELAGLALVVLLGIAFVSLLLMIAAIEAALSPTPHQSMSSNIVYALVSLIFR